MRVLVLAAGFATRLYPLTRDRAKPLLEVAGRPVLSRLCDRLLALDRVSELVVVTNGKFHHQFEDWARSERARATIRLVSNGVRTDHEMRGAIADLALGWQSSPPDSEDLLVAAGDNLLDIDLAPYLARFEQQREPALLCRRLDGAVPPRRYGEVCVDASDHVTGFREKPADPRSPLVATCTYFLPPHVRARLEEYVASEHELDAPGHFIAWLARRERVLALAFEGPFFDIGSLESLEAARAHFAAGPR